MEPVSEKHYHSRFLSLISFQYDGPDACHVLLLAATDGQHVRRYPYVLANDTDSNDICSMPPVTRVQGKKQALPGPMRIALEGTPGAW